jgi:hypothetical protein
MGTTGVLNWYQTIGGSGLRRAGHSEEPECEPFLFARSHHGFVHRAHTRSIPTMERPSCGSTRWAVGARGRLTAVARPGPGAGEPWCWGGDRRRLRVRAELVRPPDPTGKSRTASRHPYPTTGNRRGATNGRSGASSRTGSHRGATNGHRAPLPDDRMPPGSHERPPGTRTRRRTRRTQRRVVGEATRLHGHE